MSICEINADIGEDTHFQICTHRLNAAKDLSLRQTWLNTLPDLKGRKWLFPTCDDHQTQTWEESRSHVNADIEETISEFRSVHINAYIGETDCRVLTWIVNIKQAVYPSVANIKRRDTSRCEWQSNQCKTQLNKYAEIHMWIAVTKR